ncbi:MAG: hypothetical protein WA982_17710 [Rubrobacteraceae bacterium]
MSEGRAVPDDQRILDWENSPDLTAVSKDDLGSILEQLVQQEQEVSYRRRVLQGRIDLIRSELVSRGDASLSPEELARVLMDEGGGASV